MSQFEDEKKFHDGDQKDLADESSRGQIDWSRKFFKCKPGDENKVRILPVKKGAKGGWHFKAGKHFIRHSPTDIESYVCNQETYGKRCPACEKFDELMADNKREEAGAYRVKRIGVFNVIDRNNLEHGVKLYEAPIKAVWQPIVELSQRKDEDIPRLFDKYEGDKITEPGCDLLIDFKPEEQPQNMYTIYTLKSAPLGAVEEIKAWLEQMQDLVPDLIDVYKPVDYDIAYVKTFGTAAEREELKAALRRRAEKAEESDEKPQPITGKGEEKKEDEKPKPITPPAEKKEEKKEEKKKDDVESVSEKVERIKKQHEADAAAKAK